jgi:hypothetical protein
MTAIFGCHEMYQPVVAARNQWRWREIGFAKKRRWWA